MKILRFVPCLLFALVSACAGEGGPTEPSMSLDTLGIFESVRGGSAFVIMDQTPDVYTDSVSGVGLDPLVYRFEEGGQEHSIPGAYYEARDSIFFFWHVGQPGDFELAVWNADRSGFVASTYGVLGASTRETVHFVSR